MTTQAQDYFVKQWVVALRSGEYEQISGTICDGIGFCCIGVAAAVLEGNDFPALKPKESYSLVQEAAGLRTDYGDFRKENGEKDSLVAHNDHLHETFSQIADLIESRPPGLFVE